LLTGSAELGQGSDTTMAMLAAETLGRETGYDMVRLESGDTNLTIDLGAYSSRQTMMTGHATIKAAQDIKDQIIGANWPKSLGSSRPMIWTSKTA
jgi:CO/xanthine dehydrogenase Mo-binding subunit